MTTLAQLQKRFLASLRQGDDEALPLLANDRSVPRPLGWGIYVNAYAARLREVLENDHPALSIYLGDALWDTLCRGFIAARPSHLRSLRHYGGSLPAWLRHAAPFDAHPQVAELAAWERWLMDSFDAADAPAARWDTLQSLPPQQWPTLRLAFHPSLQSVRLGWNSVAIWKAVKAGQAPPDARPVGGEHWVIWRDAAMLTRYRPLPAEESRLLEHFARGGSFADGCEAMLAWHAPETIPTLAIQWLMDWTAEGWVTQWRSGSTEARGVPDSGAPPA